MQPIAQSSAAASRIETNERQLFNDLKALNISVTAYNKQVSKISGPDQFKSLERLRLDSPPELTIITAIGKRKLEITGLNISMMPQSSGAGLSDASQQYEQRNIPYDSHTEPESAGKALVPADDVSANSGNTLTSLKRPSTADSDTESSTDISDTESSTDISDTESSTYDSDTESIFQKALTAEASGTAANDAVSVNDQQLQNIAPNNRQPDIIAPIKAEIIQCQANYLELKLATSFGCYIRDVSFSPTSKNLIVNGRDDENDYSLSIWRQGADGNWLPKGKVKSSDVIFRYQLNQSENTLLSISYDGKLTMSTLNKDGRWQEAVVLEHTTTNENDPRVKADFSPLQDKMMSYDPQTGEINVLREDSNGCWTPLTQAKEISHCQQTVTQQAPFQATNHYLLTYQGTTATIWSCSDESHCLEEKKVIECNGQIGGVQLSHDEQHAVIFTEGGQAIFLGCDVDGNWSQIGEISHPEWSMNEDNQPCANPVCEASFNASGHLALTRDIDNTFIISGYDANCDANDNPWVGKTKIHRCAEAKFSASGRKLLANSGIGSFKLWDYNSSDHRRVNGQTINHSGSHKAIFSPSENLLLSYGNETNFACIWGHDEDGDLVEKARICHQGGIDYAAFNAQEDCVLTRSRDRTVKIQALGSQGKWQEQLVVQHRNSIMDARFSPSGRLAYTVSLDDTACILGRNDNGQWMKLAVTNSDADFIRDASFNELENHFLTYGNKMNKKDKHQPGLVQLWDDITGLVQLDRKCWTEKEQINGLVQLWGIGDDGKWSKKEQIKLDHPVKSAKFSPDGDHLLIYCNDGMFPIAGFLKGGTALLWKIPASPRQEADHT
ncbi:WD40 repeat domain-containing protein [Endozoicomonas sp. YOMI1]|uniref:WD40 repeat domain-containing protein n=1 Tax=Endozoicomonas sp. YOMI1 TaxID=2828739 RepID=UPI00214779BC|nr:hypothetical protein [Endozoicomonas sp. YOMI1]